MTISNPASTDQAEFPSLSSLDPVFWSAKADRLVIIVRDEADKEKRDGICAAGVTVLIDAMCAHWHDNFYEGRDLGVAVTDLRDVAAALYRTADGLAATHKRLSTEATLQTFLALLDKADNVTADSPVLDDWVTSPVTGEPKNEVVRFSWFDATGRRSCILTEEGVTGGHWEDGAFRCEDSEGIDTDIRLFTNQPLAPQ